MGLIRVKRSTYECDDLLFHNHGGAPLHSQGRQRRAAKVMRWTAWHFVNLKFVFISDEIRANGWKSHKSRCLKPPTTPSIDA